jgi:hypothetical protein
MVGPFYVGKRFTATVAGEGVPVCAPGHKRCGSHGMPEGVPWSA